MYSNFSIHFSSPERLYFVQKKKTSSNKTALIKKNIPQGKRRGQGWTTSLKISKRGFATHFEAEMGIDPSYVPPSPRVRRSLPHKGENLWKGLKYRGRIRHSNWRKSKRFTFSSCNATYRYTPLSREQRAGNQELCTLPLLLEIWTNWRGRLLNSTAELLDRTKQRKYASRRSTFLSLSPRYVN